MIWGNGEILRTRNYPLLLKGSLCTKRYLSVNSAINRSLRRTQSRRRPTSARSPENYGGSHTNYRKHAPVIGRLGRGANLPASKATTTRELTPSNDRYQRSSSRKYDSELDLPLRRKKTPEHTAKSSEIEATERKTSQISLSIPYTTSASQFLYGTSAVKAALEARRRQCHKLYVYDGDNREAPEQKLVIRKLALRNQIVVDRVKNDRLGLMDKMSGGRPHNVNF